MNLFTLAFSSSDGSDEEIVVTPISNPKRFKGQQQNKVPREPPEIHNSTPVQVRKKQVLIVPPSSSSEYEEEEDNPIEHKSHPQLHIDQEDFHDDDVFFIKPEDEINSNVQEPKVVLESHKNNKISQRQASNDAAPINVPRSIKRITNYPVYKLRKETKLHINGRRYFFSFSDEVKQLFSAKMKTKSAEFIPIFVGENTPHLSETPDYCLITGNAGQDFSLRVKIQTGDELMTIRFFNKRMNELTRKVIISFFQSSLCAPPRLRSKCPELENGNFIFDFDGRFAMKSSKNVCFAESVDEKSVLCYRKIDKKMMEIDCKFEVEPLYLFAAGIANWVSQVS